MKRMFVVLAAVATLALVPMTGLAQDQTSNSGQTPANQGMMNRQGMMGAQGTMMTHPWPMGGGMMGAMMGRAMVATEDGGVVVLSGEQLMKFDKNLNLVKKVELKIDTAAMDRWMKEMGSRCGWCRGWRGRGGRGGGWMMNPPQQQNQKNP